MKKAGDSWYFAYGSNLDIDQKELRIGTIRHAEVCRLRGSDFCSTSAARTVNASRILFLIVALKFGAQLTFAARVPWKKWIGLREWGLATIFACLSAC